MRKRKIVNLLGIFVCMLAPSYLLAQKHYPFVVDSLNVIHDSNGSLKELMLSFSHLKNAAGKAQESQKEAIPILHIGDSHLQAGFITAVIRSSMQKEFGNAGRGLVAPLKLAGTNQPRDYRITSDISWLGGRSSLRNQPFTFGISGIAIQTEEPTFSIQLEALPDSINELDYSFSRIAVFHDNAPKLTVPEDASIVSSEVVNDNAYIITLGKTIQSLQLLHFDSVAAPKTIHAFSLENGEPGVIYHTVGVNGAQYKDFYGIPLLFRQSAALHPRLIIISLGTNEAFDWSFNAKSFTENMDGLIRGLKAANPNAVFILTTPAEDYRRSRRKRIPNERIALVRNAIVSFAKQKGIAYWDCFEATGGVGSCVKWLKNGLMARDQIHFNIEGYELQGSLFFEAFMKLYQAYVAEHRVE